MDVRNCKRCGQIFNSLGNNICPKCLEQENETFNRVKAYYYVHPKASIPELSTATGVDLTIVTGYFKDGKLTMNSSTGTSILHCEKCGASVKTGRYCEDCLIALHTELTQASTPSNTNDNKSTGDDKDAWKNAKVHTYDNIFRKKD